MTLSEFYSSLDESLDEVLERLRMESRVAKYLKLFLSDPSFTELKEAFAGNDAQTAFRAAHTLKGVAANLGLRDGQTLGVFRPLTTADVESILRLCL